MNTIIPSAIKSEVMGSYSSPDMLEIIIIIIITDARHTDGVKRDAAIKSRIKGIEISPDILGLLNIRPNITVKNENRIER